MDELKARAGEKFEALHVAAKTVAGNGRTKVENIYHQTAEAIKKIQEILQDIWQNEFIIEGRERVGAWTRDTVKRIKEGAPPLSPILLYEELVALFKDRGVQDKNNRLEAEPKHSFWNLLLFFQGIPIWRRSVIIFSTGVALGGLAGLLLGLRAARRPPAGPHCRALHSLPDGSVILLEDAVAPALCSGEVLIRVQAFSVCGADRAALRGRGALLRALLGKSNVTVGRGFSGVVLDVGYGVTDLELGDEVWGCVSEWHGGAASELLAIRSTRVSRRPRSLAADAAATLPWAGGVALAALNSLKLTAHNSKGKRVAIAGAASGEGCYLVQLLSNWGAHVTVTAPRLAKKTLLDLGAIDFLEAEGEKMNDHRVSWSWSVLERWGARVGPWDAVVACAGAGTPPQHPPPNTLLKATAGRSAALDVRGHALISDRLPTPLAIVYAATFTLYRLLRYMCRCGRHTDWLEPEHRLTPGLHELKTLVDIQQLGPVLDQVYLPQDFESALAHACSDEALGTTVIRFP